MANLEDLKSTKALNILKEYEGKNPYIKKFKRELTNTGDISLTTNQCDYIINNYKFEPKVINKVVGISEYLGTELKNQYNLSFIPERILIEYLLADNDKTFHIYGKLKRNQEKSQMYFIPKSQLLDDFLFEEKDIEVDFEKYESIDKFVLSNGTIGRKLYEQQKDGVKFLLSRKGAILADSMGVGKRIADDQKVLTPNGWRLHGELKVGDYVIGSNGKPTKVLATYPNDKDKYYNITFTDGTIVEACENHLWAVRSSKRNISKSNFNVLSVKDMLDENLQLIKNGSDYNKDRKYKYKTYYKLPNNDCRWYIPMVEPVEFNKREITIDPYLLGCLLGDGGFSTHNIKLISADEELINECITRLPENCTLKKIKETYNYRLNKINSNNNTVIQHLKKYELMGLTSENKFIPEDYKYNTKEVRLEILQGLLDTDGYCSNKNGLIRYYTTSKQLSNDVIEIVQSLGGVARKSSKIGKYKNKDGIIIICKKCYILSINIPENIIPFKLERKLNNMKKVRKYLPSRGIKDITFSRETSGQCITVDAEDSLYVIDNYVVTHNTVQATVAALESGCERILIVCPSAVKINWQREIGYYDCHDSVIIDGKKWEQDKFTIINFDILKNFHVVPGEGMKEEDICWDNQELVKANFDLIIIDEAHKLKNHKSNRGAIMKDLCTNYGEKRVWLLSGTPVANRPMDYYNLLALINSPIVANWKHYVIRYCEGKQITTTLKNGRQKKVWLTNGASNLEELALKTKNTYLRRLKSDLGDMPEKTIIPIYHKLTDEQWVKHNELWEEYLIERQQKKKRGEPERDLVELGLLRKYIAMQSISKTIELVEDILESGEKVIIFCNFTEELTELKNHFGKRAVTHYGQMSDKDKQKSIDDFQLHDKAEVFIGNIISAGVGITLTKATYVVFNSFDWVPGNNEQGEDRSYRLGQKNNVTIYYQLFENTISVRMWETLKQKQNIIDTIMNEAGLDEDEIIGNIMNKILEEDE